MTLRVLLVSLATTVSALTVHLLARKICSTTRRDTFTLSTSGTISTTVATMFFISWVTEVFPPFGFAAITRRSTYVSVKVTMALSSETEESEEVKINKTLASLISASDTEAGTNSTCVALDFFKFEGPNGTHMGIVYPVLGPYIGTSLLQHLPEPDKALRNICFETTQAVDFLHRHGVCHGGMLLCPNLIQTSDGG